MVPVRVGHLIPFAAVDDADAPSPDAADDEIAAADDEIAAADDETAAADDEIAAADDEAAAPAEPAAVAPVAAEASAAGDGSARRRRSPWPVVAALAGAGLIALNVVLLLQLVGVRSDLEDVTGRLGDLGLAVGDVGATVGDVEARVGGVEGRLDELAAGATGAEASGVSAAPAQPPAPEGALPRFTPGSPDAAIGVVVGTISGVEYYSGETTVVDAADGTPRAWLIWAHWCPYCQEEMPDLKSWHEANAAAFPNFELVSITTSIDESRGNPLIPYLDDQQLPFPVLVDPDGALAASFGVSAFPFWVFTGPDGAVLGRSAGLLGAAQFTSLFEQLDAIGAAA